MVFRRGARPSWYFTGRTRTGWEQVCSFAKDQRLAKKVEGMWGELAEDHRAFDVLDRVLNGEMSAAELFDVWKSATVNRSLPALRRHLNDSDLEPIVEEFLTMYGRQYPGAVDHIRAHLRFLIPEGAPFLASRAAPDYLTERLYAHGHRKSATGPLVPSSSNTLRKVHSSWSSFFAYCVKPRRFFAMSPMLEVERPPLKKSPVEFYDLETIERIVEWQSTPERRAVLALLYGGAIESTTALGLRRADLDPTTKEVRAPGTKAHTRDRVCRLDAWAWDYVWEIARTMLPTARLFPAEWTRHQVHDWHSAALRALEITPRLKPYASRHAWAARYLRAGTPIAVVQSQLGHGSPMLTLSLYGRFMPDSSDRAAWEQKVTDNEQKRREAR